jgi:hypothetical protein
MPVVNAKAAEEWTEKEISQAPYDLRRVEGPAYTGAAPVAVRAASCPSTQATQPAPLPSQQDTS